MPHNLENSCRGICSNQMPSPALRLFIYVALTKAQAACQVPVLLELHLLQRKHHSWRKGPGMAICYRCQGEHRVTAESCELQGSRASPSYLGRSWQLTKAKAVCAAHFYPAQMYLNVCLLLSLKCDLCLYKPRRNNLILSLYDLLIQNRQERKGEVSTTIQNLSPTVFGILGTAPKPCPLHMQKANGVNSGALCEVLSYINRARQKSLFFTGNRALDLFESSSILFQFQLNQL